MHFLGWLIIGGLAGYLVGKIMSGHGYGIVGDVLLGVIGSFLGGYLFRDVFHIEVIGVVTQFAAAFLGALIVVGLLHVLRREPVIR